MFISSSSDDRNGYPTELIRYSLRMAAAKSAAPAREDTGIIKGYQLGNYAPTLMPLNERDTKELGALFEREDIDEIEADITKNLFWLSPALCWEDNPFDFLQEYL